MTTEMLLNGLHDVQQGRISHLALADMLPEIVEHLSLLTTSGIKVPYYGTDHVYICGKVTGLRYTEAVQHFNDAEQMLRLRGYKTVNPVTLMPETTPWSAAMRICMIAMIKYCDKIYLLPNWEDSAGARVEKNLADALRFSNIELSAS